jgi:hypothetical protein
VTRRRAIILAVVALVVALDVFLWVRLGQSGDDDEPSPKSASSSITATSSDGEDATTPPATSQVVPSSAGATSSTPPSEPAISLETRDQSVPILAVVKLTGEYPGAPPGTELRVQRLVDGTWVDFPLPTVVQPSGRFVTRVQMGGTGTNKIRVVEPDSGDRSNTIAIEIS